MDKIFEEITILNIYATFFLFFPLSICGFFLKLKGEKYISNILEILHNSILLILTTILIYLNIYSNKMETIAIVSILISVFIVQEYAKKFLCNIGFFCNFNAKINNKDLLSKINTINTYLSQPNKSVKMIYNNKGKSIDITSDFKTVSLVDILNSNADYIKIVLDMKKIFNPSVFIEKGGVLKFYTTSDEINSNCIEIASFRIYDVSLDFQGNDFAINLTILKKHLWKYKEML